MSAPDRLFPGGMLVAVISCVVLTALHVATAHAGATRADKAHVRPDYPVAYPLYLHHGACLYGACGALWWSERRPIRRPIAPVEVEPAEQDIWGTAGSPWGYVRRLPPPTPESHIQPRYRDASTVRPEFAERGDGAKPD